MSVEKKSFKKFKNYQFLLARKLGNDELISAFIRRIQNATDEKLKMFEEENTKKHKEFIVSEKLAVILN